MEKTQVFGHLKTRLFIINTSKHVGFGGPLGFFAVSFKDGFLLPKVALSRKRSQESDSLGHVGTLWLEGTLSPLEPKRYRWNP